MRPSVTASRGRSVRRWLPVLAGLAIGVATFLVVLPQVASYGDVWDVVGTLSLGWGIALGAATVANVATFAPPWAVALPGLGLRRSLAMTQASTALSIVVPGGAAVGMAGSYGMLRSWGFGQREVATAVTLTGVWNQLANVAFPAVALMLLLFEGGTHPLLTTAALVGLAAFVAILGALLLALQGDALAARIGDVTSRAASRAIRLARRRPVGWDGASFVRFRREASRLVGRRWHLLTLTTLAGHLTVFVVLIVALRALGVATDDVSSVEAFAAWALMRLATIVPLTPGGIGIVELGLTGLLAGFGGESAAVVAAVLVWRFLTVTPTLALGLLAVATWRHHRPESR